MVDQNGSDQWLKGEEMAVRYVKVDDDGRRVAVADSKGKLKVVVSARKMADRHNALVDRINKLASERDLLANAIAKSATRINNRDGKLYVEA